MGHLNKRARQLRAARETKRQQTWEKVELEIVEEDCSPLILHNAHWEGILSDEEESDIEMSEVEDNIPDDANVFEVLLNNAEKEAHHPSYLTKFLYQRGSELSERQQRRIRAREKELADASRNHSQPITQFFSPTSTASVLNKSPTLVPTQPQVRQMALDNLKKKLDSKKTVLEGQQLLTITQLRQDGETREDLSYSVARSYNKGRYFARRIVEWEGLWIRERRIPEGKRGCFAKSFSW